ncbi:SDR family oxidoreductase [Pseudonocardia acaciae]|uniref:SDR family oxidoreductase n=1 Tax=Pseudonocardia acaciae TaxID=551276 RepID=UPI00048A8B75|nr:NAD(P)H-binding protein [Pseudonocardia acaciae]
MTILITGARGTVGAGLLHRLHDLGHDVRAASRAPQWLDTPPGVAVTTLDLADPATFAPALAGVTGVFLYAEPAGIHDLLTAASAAGVERIVLLSSDSTTEPNAESAPLARHHLTVERAVQASPIPATVLRPGAFATNALSWSGAIRTGQPVEQAYPDARTSPIHPDDIVDVATLALTTDTLLGQAITLSGPEPLSFRDQLAILSDLTARPIELHELTRTQAHQRMTAHMPTPIVESLLDYWAAAQARPVSAEHAADRITGRPARSFRTWATEHLDAFCGQPVSG